MCPKSPYESFSERKDMLNIPPHHTHTAKLSQHQSSEQTSAFKFPEIASQSSLVNSGMKASQHHQGGNSSAYNRTSQKFNDIIPKQLLMSNTEAQQSRKANINILIPKRQQMRNQQNSRQVVEEPSTGVTNSTSAHDEPNLIRIESGGRVARNLFLPQQQTQTTGTFSISQSASKQRRKENNDDLGDLARIVPNSAQLKESKVNEFGNRSQYGHLDTSLKKTYKKQRTVGITPPGFSLDKQISINSVGKQDRLAIGKDQRRLQKATRNQIGGFQPDSRSLMPK